MQTLQKSSFSGKSLLFTLISFSELETNTQYSIIEIERDDAERADLGRVGDMKSDAGALIVIPIRITRTVLIPGSGRRVRLMPAGT